VGGKKGTETKQCTEADFAEPVDRAFDSRRELNREVRLTNGKRGAGVIWSDTNDQYCEEKRRQGRVGP